MRSDREHCASRVAVEEEEERRGGGGEEQAIDIKSNNPYLTGGEKESWRLSSDRTSGRKRKLAPVFRQNFRQELPSECELTGGVTVKIISWILLIIILRWFYCLCESFVSIFHTLKIISKIILQPGDCFEMIVEPPQTNFIVNMLEIILR